ncbi:MAG: hypothetical protein C0504_02215 [Candidatus Solibacter sp.]|nr:hypothetical protein [Candidatus Solibacter sp.]
MLNCHLRPGPGPWRWRPSQPRRHSSRLRPSPLLLRRLEPDAHHLQPGRRHPQPHSRHARARAGARLVAALALLVHVIRHQAVRGGIVTVFLDPLALTFPDPGHSIDEMREITIGCTTGNAIVFVSHRQRGQRLRLISARKATTNERKHYEEAIC